MKKVSILIPCYNSAEFLEETLISCINQTYPHIEVIVVDDGSTDETYQIGKQYEAEHIHVYKQANGGACKARNYAFSQSSGDYIMFLDADDLMTPDKIQVQMDILLESPENTIAFSRWERFYTTTDEVLFQNQLSIYKDYENPVDLLTDIWMGKGMLANCCYLIPRAIAEKEKWDESLSINQDGEYFCRILLHVSQLKFNSLGGVYYRSGIPDSITAKQGSLSKGLCLLKTYISYEKSVLPVCNSLNVRKALAMNYCSVAYIYLSFPEIFSKAYERYLRLDTVIRSVPIGGWKFRFISSIIGFWNLLGIKRKLA